MRKKLLFIIAVVSFICLCMSACRKKEEEIVYGVNSLGYLVNFSNIYKTPVEYMEISGVCAQVYVPKIPEGTEIYVIDDEEKAIFREAFDELHMGAFLDRKYSYDVIIRVGKRLLMFDLKNNLGYCVYDLEKPGETYRYELSEEQRAFVLQLGEK